MPEYSPNLTSNVIAAHALPCATSHVAKIRSRFPALKSPPQLLLRQTMMTGADPLTPFKFQDLSASMSESAAVREAQDEVISALRELKEAVAEAGSATKYCE